MILLLYSYYVDVYEFPLSNFWIIWKLVYNIQHLLFQGNVIQNCGNISRKKLDWNSWQGFYGGTMVNILQNISFCFSLNQSQTRNQIKDKEKTYVIIRKFTWIYIWIKNILNILLQQVQISLLCFIYMVIYIEQFLDTAL